MSLALLSNRRFRAKKLEVAGEKLAAKVKELVREGNVKRISIADSRGRVVLEVPVTVGVVGAILRPSWVAIGAIASLASRHTLFVERAK